jgi:tetratricopeptide (TPR) repeat protein
MIRKIAEIQSQLKAAVGEERLKLLSELTYAYLKHDPKLCLNVAAETMTMARELNQPRTEATAMHYLGLALMHLGRLQEALSTMQEAMSRRSNLGDEAGVASCQAGIACVYRQFGDFETSLSYFLQSLAAEERLGQVEGAASALNNVANLYTVMKDYPPAIDAVKRALALYTQLNDDYHISACLNNMSSIYKHLGDRVSALRCAREALEVKERIDHKLGIAISLHNLGVLHHESGELDAAQAEFERALTLTDELGEIMGSGMVSASLGHLFIEKRDPDRAWPFLERSLAIAREKDAKILEHETMRVVADYHAARGDFEKALQAFMKFAALKDVIIDKERAEKLAAMRSRYEHEKAEREAEIYRLRNTELAKALEDLENAQDNILRLERRNSVFATAVTASHEINQPLQVISGALDLLELTFTEADERQTHYIDQARQGVDRIGDILVRLLGVEEVIFEPYTRQDDSVSIIRTQPPETPKE